MWAIAATGFKLRDQFNFSRLDWISLLMCFCEAAELGTEANGQMQIVSCYCKANKNSIPFNQYFLYHINSILAKDKLRLKYFVPLASFSIESRNAESSTFREASRNVSPIHSEGIFPICLLIAFTSKVDSR